MLSNFLPPGLAASLVRFISSVVDWRIIPKAFPFCNAEFYFGTVGKDDRLVYHLFLSRL